MQPPIGEANVTPLVFWDDVGRIYLKLAGRPARRALRGRGAVELTDVVERVREKHVERAAQEANDAFERRWRRSS